MNSNLQTVPPTLDHPLIQDASTQALFPTTLPKYTIQDDDIIEATPPHATPPPLPAIELQRCLDTNEAHLDSFVRKVETKFKQQGHQLEEILGHLTDQRDPDNRHEEDNNVQRGNIAPKNPLQFVKKAFPWVSESVVRDIVAL